MKIHTQQSPAMTQLAEWIAPFSVGMLTRLCAEGRLEAKPMTPLEMDEGGAIWFFVDRRHTRAEQLALLNLGFSDPGGSTFVSLSGSGELTSEREAIERLWTEFARPWFPDGPGSPELALLKFSTESAEFWDAPQSRTVRMLALVASVMARKPIGMGEHTALDALENDASITKRAA